MTDRPDLDRLWTDVPVGQPALDTVLRGGTRLRRTRQAFGGLAVVVVVALIGGAASLASEPRTDRQPDVTATPDADATPGGRTTATLFYLLDEPTSEDGYFEPATLLTARTVEVEATDSPGYDALHALFTLEPPSEGLTEGFNVLDQPGQPPTIDVRSVVHEGGVVRVELTGTPEDPYPTVDFCCPSDGSAVAQQVVHTVQAALDTTDPVAFNAASIWLEKLDGPVEADPNIVVPPHAGSPAGKVELPTSDWKYGDEAMTARLVGRLSLTGGCLVVDTGGFAPAIVVWPKDYAAWVVGREAVLLDAQGRLVAREGDRIEVGGGEPGHFGIPCAPDEPRAFFVQSDVTVLR